MACLLDRNIDFSCVAKPLLVVDKIRLINFSEWVNVQSVTEDSTTGISAITLESGTQAYTWNVGKGSQQITPTSAFKANDGIDTYTHSLGIRVTGVTQEIVNEIKKTKTEKQVAVLEFSDGSGVMLGRDNGLTQTEFDFNLDTSTSGTLMLTLATRATDPGESSPIQVIAPTFDFTTLDTPAA